MGFLSKLWSSLRRLLAIVAIIVLLYLAWEIFVVAAPTTLASFAWAGSLAGPLAAFATWAAASPWLFAPVAVVVVGLLDPELIQQLVDGIARGVKNLVEWAVDVATDVAAALIPDWLVWLVAGLGFVYLSRNGGGNADRPAAR